MGFGILIIGYFLAFLMSNLHPAFAFAGSYLIFVSLTKLKKYKKSFENALIPTAFMMLISLFNTARALCENFYIDVPFLENEILNTVLGYAYIAAVFAFHVVLLMSVASLAKQNELEKIRVMSLRNLVFFVTYTVLYFVALIPFPDVVMQYIRLILSIMQLFWTLLDIILILRCFSNMHDAEKYERWLEKEAEEEAKKNVEK